MENETAMNMLIEDIRNASGIDHLKAELALGAMLTFLGSHLPSPIMGRITEALSYGSEIKKLGNPPE